MSAQLSIFPESRDEAAARLDGIILDLILGHNGGPLGLTLEDDEKTVLRAIRFHRGLANTIAIHELSNLTRLSARQIKKSVRTLRMNFRLPIGSSKSGTDGGYYLILSEEDRAAWVNDVLNQVRAELAVLRAAAGQQAMWSCSANSTWR
jgi:S-ribosylhomocysteine lyase LuxS involved in autoinducer biosynthesis